jgi:hypothetical protein
MTTLQLWIIAGVPAIFTAVVLLIGGSPMRARVALGVIVAFAVALALVPGAGGPSIAALGLPVMVLVASGRLEGETRVPHHADRRRYTTADGA